MIRANVESVPRFTARTLLHAADENGYGPKTSQDDVDTQQPLATRPPPRLPSLARPSFRGSTKSQNADAGGNVAPILESQEGLATQSNLVNPQHAAAITEPPRRDRSALLQLLKTRRPPITSPKDQPGQTTHDSSEEANRPSVSNIVTSGENTKGQNQDIAKPGEVEMSSQGQTPTITSPPPQTRFVENSHARSSQRLNQSNSQSQEEATSFQKAPSSPSLRTSPMLEATVDLNDNANTDVNGQNPRSTERTGTKTNSERDIWNNMTKISRRDVAIPKDQEELLDRQDCWIPADVGEPVPRGHVPTSLLQEWNAKMIRLFHETRKDTLSQKSDSSSDREEEELSENDTDSESEISGWSPSPPRDIQRPRAPPDSPIGRQSISKPVQLPKEDATKTADDVDGISEPVKSHTTQPTSPPSPTILQNDHTQEANTQDANDPKGDGSQTSILSSAPVSTADRPSKGDEPAESSDESDMETSIPQALTTGSQSIADKAEGSEDTAPVSSNTSSAPVGKVQIFDTPAGVLKRKTSGNANKTRNLLSTYTAQQSSSDSNKSSSQVNANSVDSTGNTSAQEHEMDYTQRPLVADSQRTNGELHDSSLPSHQDSQRVEAVPESSLNSADLHTQVYIRADQPAGEVTNSNPSPPMPVAVESKLKRKAEEIQSSDGSPLKRRKSIVNEETHAASTQLTTHSELEYVRHRRIFSGTPDGPQKIFQMFKNSYPKYAGDFEHFASMCRRLQTLRGRGILQKCFLWDEFVIRHLLDYTSYVQACIYAKKDWEENYEQYFCSEFTRPSFKQRSLTPRTLDIVAPKRDNSIPEVIVTAHRGTQTVIPTSSSLQVDESPVKNQSQIIEETQASAINDEEVSESIEIDESFSDHERHETASLELGIQPEEEEGHADDDDDDYDDDARTSLISRIRRENQQTVQALFNTEVPKRAKNSNYLDEDTPFKQWLKLNENFSLQEQRGGSSLQEYNDKDGRSASPTSSTHRFNAFRKAPFRG